MDNDKVIQNRNFNDFLNHHTLWQTLFSYLIFHDHEHGHDGQWITYYSFNLHKINCNQTIRAILRCVITVHKVFLLLTSFIHSFIFKLQTIIEFLLICIIKRHDNFNQNTGPFYLPRREKKNTKEEMKFSSRLCKSLCVLGIVTSKRLWVKIIQLCA